MSAKRAAKRITQPVYMRVARLVDPETGELVGALVPESRTAQKQMHERRMSVGTVVRAEFRKPRNVGFHRLVHALGTIAREQIEALSDTTDAHDCIKRLQREAGVCCEVQVLDLGALGKHGIRVARSIAFDAMDEGEFRELMEGLCDHIARTYWPTLTAAQVEEMAELMVNR